MLDERLSRIWDQKRREWREVRGNILAACFELEYLLDGVLCEVFFPGADEPSNENQPSVDRIAADVDARTLRKLFDGLVLKSGLIPFRRKIELLSDLSSGTRPLEKLVSDNLVSMLHKIRDIRNRFAHYPVTFTPLGDPPNQELQATLVCRDKELVLDDKFFGEYNPLFSSALAEMEELFKRLKQENGKA